MWEVCTRPPTAPRMNRRRETIERRVNALRFCAIGFARFARSEMRHVGCSHVRHVVGFVTAVA